MVSMVVLGFVMIAEFAARVAEFSKNFNDCFMSFGALIGLILILHATVYLVPMVCDMQLYSIYLSRS